jgi:hypothetical protein
MVPKPRGVESVRSRFDPSSTPDSPPGEGEGLENREIGAPVERKCGICSKSLQIHGTIESEQQMNERCLMSDKHSSPRESDELVCVWITVPGPDGRVHLESRWLLAGGAATQPAA